MITEDEVTMVFHSARFAISQERNKPKPMPSTPPPPEISTDFGEELADDIGAPRADGPPDADLARALQHCGKHDVHDPDAADQQRNGRNRHHHVGEDGLRSLLLGEQRGGDGDGEILHVVMRGVQNRGHHFGHCTLSAPSLSRRSTPSSSSFMRLLTSQKRY